MLPTVEIAYKLPTVAPLRVLFFSFNLAAKGDTIPSNIDGTVKSNNDERTETILTS